MMIDKLHAEIWRGFYRSFTHDESQTLYGFMKKKKIPAGKVIYRQGDFDPGLFFIDSGSAAVFFNRQEKNHLVKKYGTGDLLGISSFFSLTNCTESVLAASDIKLHHLTKDSLDVIKDKHPAIPSKLVRYCAKIDKLNQFFKKETFNRRENTRYKVNGRAHINIMTKSNTSSNINILGDLSDLSQGGAAVQVRINGYKKAKALLGRSISVHAKVMDIGIRDDIQKTGKIISVNDLFFNNFNVCIMFNSDVENLLVSEFPGANYEF